MAQQCEFKPRNTRKGGRGETLARLDGVWTKTPEPGGTGKTAANSRTAEDLPSETLPTHKGLITEVPFTYCHDWILTTNYVS